MSSYSEFHVEFNGYSPINRNDPQQVKIFGPAGLKKDVNKSIAEFASVFAQSGLYSAATSAKVLSLVWSLFKSHRLFKAVFQNPHSTRKAMKRILTSTHSLISK